MVQSLFNGLVLSAVYLLVALGLTITFGLTRLVNFAHGMFLVIGAFTAYELIGSGMSFWLACPLATVITGVLGLLLEQAIFKPTLKAPLSGFITSIGVLLVLQTIAVHLWGTQDISINFLSDIWKPTDYLTISATRVAVLVATAGLTVILLIAIRFTGIGRQMRAVQDDPVASAHLGINGNRMIAIVFSLGAACAGLAGALLVTLLVLGVFSGLQLLLIGFAVALAGGLGNVTGAILASIVFGVGTELVSDYVNPTWTVAVPYVLIILAVLLRRGSSTGSVAMAPERVSRAYTLSTREKAIIAGVLSLVLIFGYRFIPVGQYQSLAVVAIIYAIAAFGLGVVFNLAGMFALAPGVCIGAGAYAAALASIHWGLNFWAALPLSILAGAAVGGIIGYVSAKASGYFLALVTFACAELLIFLATQWSATGGDVGVQIVPVVAGIGSAYSHFYYLCAGFLLLCIAAYAWLERSVLGGRLQAVRDHESLAASLGLGIRTSKTVAFIIGGAFSGLSGLLLLYYLGAINTVQFSFSGGNLGLIVLGSIMLGGKNLLGPPVAAFILVMLPNLIQIDPQDSTAVYGAILMVIALLLPQGIGPAIQSLYGNARHLVRQRVNGPQLAASAPVESTVEKERLPEPR